MIESHIVPRARDLGDGFQVRRALPDAQRRSVGPFVFFDQMGPAVLSPGAGLDVRPHPHIGLATVTWLFEGEILHRDSLGSVQPIRPGAVNWMVAGRGIAHSERSPPEARPAGPRLFGVQTWIALPAADEECAPAFSHHANLAVVEEGGIALTLILGDLLGLSSPVPIHSPTFYAEVSIAATRSFAVPARHEERGVFVVDGAVRIGGKEIARGEMVVLQPGADVLIEAPAAARIMIFGGARLESPRYVWWNFVSSRRERIVQAAEDWKAGRFARVPGDDEFIPLPDKAPRWVDYP
ncbi:MAG TPA: pirin family protein [Usitatibacter sp.]|nr:pirin family protein [Usitatibacter sp.]